MFLPGLAPRLVRVSAGVLGLGLLLTACSTSGESATGTKGYVSGGGAITTVDVEHRQQLPEAKGTTLDGKQVDVADYRGRVVVLNVWASWCTECRAEVTDLNNAAEQLPNAVFLGINTRDQEAAAKAYVREQEVPYDSLVDDGGLLLSFTELNLRPDSIPSTIVVDQEGRVASVVLGEVTEATLVGLVEDVEGT